MLLQCKLFSFKRLSNNENQIKDDKNDNNLDACVANLSHTLGKCRLSCQDDSDCQTTCLEEFDENFLNCPCQVFFLFESRMTFTKYRRKIVPLDALVRSITARLKQKWLFWFFQHLSQPTFLFFSYQMVERLLFYKTKLLFSRWN